jgi:hypothetical protein
MNTSGTRGSRRFAVGPRHALTPLRVPKDDVDVGDGAVLGVRDGAAELGRLPVGEGQRTKCHRKNSGQESCREAHQGGGDFCPRPVRSAET